MRPASAYRDHAPMIPKSRLDALTDGVFGFAMTLLVVDLRLPDDFRPHESAELLAHLAGLANQLIVYLVSFYVLALRWLGVVRLEPPGVDVSGAYTRYAMIHLLLVTFVPFATMLVGRYAALPPA